MEEGLKEGKSLESLPDNKENMEDSGMNDLLEEESNVVDIPLGDENYRKNMKILNIEKIAVYIS